MAQNKADTKMTREQIEKAAREYSDVIWNNDRARDISKIAYSAGAQWRINSVWHDASEKPNVSKPVLLIYDGNRYRVGYFIEKNLYRSFRCRWTINRWAYVEDLLPDGKEARIICFDKKDERPIIALVQSNKREDAYYYSNDGVNLINGTLSENDLMMLPEKKEGWVNIYQECNGIRVERFVYKTEKEAFDNAEPDNYIATAKIQWEE